MDTGNRIGATTCTMPSDREFAMTRVFDSPRRLVWKVWTNREHLPKWMLGPPGWTMRACEIDLRPGGAWHFVWPNTDGTDMEMRGVYREIVPPERLFATESWGGDWPETVDTLVLVEENGHTTITQTILYASTEAREAELKTGKKGGIAQSFDRLAEYLQTAE
jgi:uncharacterized protein YndB with AHSA1/START domain